MNRPGSSARLSGRIDRPSSGRSLAAQVLDDVLGLGPRDYPGKLLEAGLAQAGEAAEPPQQLLGGALLDTGDILQRLRQRSARAEMAGRGVSITVWVLEASLATALS